MISSCSKTNIERIRIIKDPVRIRNGVGNLWELTENTYTFIDYLVAWEGNLKNGDI